MNDQHDPTYQIPMTMFGVPIADVFTEWHRRWTTDPEGYLSWAESLAQVAEEYGPAAQRTMLAIARDLSPWDEGPAA